MAGSRGLMAGASRSQHRARTLCSQVLVPILEADLTFHPASHTSKKPGRSSGRRLKSRPLKSVTMKPKRDV